MEQFQNKVHQINDPNAWSNQNEFPKWNIQFPIEAKPNPGLSHSLLSEITNFSRTMAKAKANAVPSYDLLCGGWGGEPFFNFFTGTVTAGAVITGTITIAIAIAITLAIAIAIALALANAIAITIAKPAKH